MKHALLVFGVTLDAALLFHNVNNSKTSMGSDSQLLPPLHVRIALMPAVYPLEGTVLSEAVRAVSSNQSTLTSWSTPSFMFFLYLFMNSEPSSTTMHAKIESR